MMTLLDSSFLCVHIGFLYMVMSSCGGSVIFPYLSFIHLPFTPNTDLANSQTLPFAESATGAALWDP